MNRASVLLAAARRRYDAQESVLPAQARSALWGGFGGGAEWMRAALSEVRETPPSASAAWERVGWSKYGTALAWATLAAVPALWLPGVAAPVGAAILFVVAFYCAEARAVFLFPVLLEGTPRPRHECRRLVRAAGGTLSVARTTARIAAHMLGGGLLGQGFLRSWCVGCLAVVLWYEALRQP